MELRMEISDGNRKGEGDSLTLLELYEYCGFDLIKVLETETGVEDGATCDIEIFLSK
jgi:hypothetical protein